MSILVTGGAGYIGSHTVNILNKKNYNVIVYDNLSTGHKESVKDNIFIKGDILDSALLQKVMQEYSITSVVHFAAYSSVKESTIDPKSYYTNNIKGTLTLLDTMLAAGVKNLVFSSTAAVYGEPDTNLISEDTYKNPINPYGKTKLALENAMADYNKAYGLNYIALRYFNACGADPEGNIGEDHENESHLIPLILKACLNNTPIKIFGDDYPTSDGTCIRDYIHVNDLSDAHYLALKALEEKTISADYFNLGNGNGFSVKEVIAACESVTGQTIKKEIAPRREGDPPILVADSKKIRTKLFWQPKFTNIEDIIKTAWQWHKNFPNGYK